jgi:hypothetical protein
MKARTSTILNRRYRVAGMSMERRFSRSDAIASGRETPPRNVPEGVPHPHGVEAQPKPGGPMVREARPAANYVVEIFGRLAVRSRIP